MILFALIAMVSFITCYMAGIHLRENLEGLAKTRFPFLVLFSTPGALFSMVQFVAFFGPLIGLVLGFDSINRERAHGTLIKLISQPIYRDAVINGKFLAGVATISIMLLSIVLIISGLGMAFVGLVPGIEELWRLFIYLIIKIIYTKVRAVRCKTGKFFRKKTKADIVITPKQPPRWIKDRIEAVKAKYRGE